MLTRQPGNRTNHAPAGGRDAAGPAGGARRWGPRCADLRGPRDLRHGARGSRLPPRGRPGGLRRGRRRPRRAVAAQPPRVARAAPGAGPPRRADGRHQHALPRPRGARPARALAGAGAGLRPGLQGHRLRGDPRRGGHEAPSRSGSASRPTRRCSTTSPRRTPRRRTPRAWPSRHSGTTGRPKLVVHAQRGIVAHARAVAAGFGYDAPDCVALAMLPLCGVFGYDSALGALAGGAPVVLQEAFDAREAAALIGAPPRHPRQRLRRDGAAAARGRARPAAARGRLRRLRRRPARGRGRRRRRRHDRLHVLRLDRGPGAARARAAGRHARSGARSPAARRSRRRPRCGWPTTASSRSAARA